MRASPPTVVLVALLTVLAGCTGATVPSGTEGGQPGGSAADVVRDTDGGAVNFWISDERNDIDDFEQLNVTITKVAFHRADADDVDADETASDGEADADEAGEPDEADGDETAARGNESEAGPPDDAGQTDEEGDESRGEDSGEPDEEEGDEPDAEGAGPPDDAGEAGDGGPSADNPDWVVVDVDNRTVDLTRLQGENATLIGAFNVPEGRYDKVFLYVDGINATLAGSGESANVKLPSGRLHLNQGFRVGANSSPDFVFDISVTRAGQSGKYVLRPVASESGTDVPIRDVDDPGNGPPVDAGPPEDRGNGSAEDAGQAEDAGPPEDRGNESAGDGGPPDDAGPPDDPGAGDGDDADDASEQDRQESEEDEGEEEDESEGDESEEDESE